MLRARRYLETLLWATLQNAGTVVGFLYTVEFYKTAQWIPATLTMIAGAILTVVVVALVRARQSPGQREPAQWLLTNTVIIAAIGLAQAIIVSRGTGLSSFAAGAMLGFGLAVAQAVATRSPAQTLDVDRAHQSDILSIVRQGFTIGLGAGVALSSLNLLLKLEWPAWANALLVLGIMSPITAALDFPPRQRQGT
jgi:hypothetical protein